MVDEQGGSNASRVSHVEVVCGSWSDNDYISCDEHDTQVRQSIADAMSDARHQHHAAHHNRSSFYL